MDGALSTSALLSRQHKIINCLCSSSTVYPLTAKGGDALLVCYMNCYVTVTGLLDCKGNFMRFNTLLYRLFQMMKLYAKYEGGPHLDM